ncbi:protealysin inhibitor emfourin [Kosakonia sp. BYX6]|uniref:Protealysin inhibitor emfourin n=1 Tax=Kosakonia calanthes TaxID=3139408 RepID=A0ABZ3BCK0_9ENTR
MNEPELTDDAVVELAREGGLAFIPKLAGTRRIVIAQLSAEQRQRLVDILHQALPLGQQPGKTDSPGRGDQRFYRLQITWTSQQPDMLLLIPESKAPPSFVELWREGEACICKP